MNDDEDGEPQTICSALPLAVADDGQLYISCEAVIKVLRVIALACQRSADDADTHAIGSILMKPPPAPGRGLIRLPAPPSSGTATSPAPPDRRPHLR